MHRHRLALFAVLAGPHLADCSACGSARERLDRSGAYSIPTVLGIGDRGAPGSAVASAEGCSSGQTSLLANARRAAPAPATEPE
jgi:hypothetical protein